MEKTLIVISVYFSNSLFLHFCIRVFLTTNAWKFFLLRKKECLRKKLSRKNVSKRDYGEKEKIYCQKIKCYYVRSELSLFQMIGKLFCIESMFYHKANLNLIRFVVEK